MPCIWMWNKSGGIYRAMKDRISHPMNWSSWKLSYKTLKGCTKNWLEKQCRKRTHFAEKWSWKVNLSCLAAERCVDRSGLSSIWIWFGSVRSFSLWLWLLIMFQWMGLFLTAISLNWRPVAVLLPSYSRYVMGSIITAFQDSLRCFKDSLEFMREFKNLLSWIEVVIIL